MPPPQVPCERRSVWFRQLHQSGTTLRRPVLRTLDFVVSFALTSVLFGAIYKILPDVELTWRDVLVLRQFHLPGQQLDQSAPGRGQGRVASR
jgi:hypothetical protein